MDSRRFEYANLANLTFIEQLYSQYLKDPSQLDQSWQRFFEGMAFGSKLDKVGSLTDQGSQKKRELPILELIEGYRIYGHQMAKINPISLEEKETIPELELEKFGFQPSDLGQEVLSYGLLKEEKAPLSTVIERLKQIYCGSVGFEYKGIVVPELERFIIDKVESSFPASFSHEGKKELLHQLNRSEAFEAFIHMKYPGQKRFSLEGAETLIPLVHELIEEGGEEGVKSVVIGMAHRGRLNILANILNKSYATIFHEFESHYIPDSFEGSGDVKYHKGFSSEVETKKGKKVELYLAANPSHLESVDPVVEGQVRARQIRQFGGKTQEVVPLLIHGDAAIAGQGVVYETMQLYKIPGYGTGGTIHLVINNQIGFTANPLESRSMNYCTDLAKAFQAPVFHVNAEDPEQCLFIARLAMQIRRQFASDVFIELNCYRKYGHNETDEPGFTQPKIYQKIREKKNIRDLYQEQLIQGGKLLEKEVKEIEDEFKTLLEKELEETKALAEKKKEVSLPKEKEVHLEQKPTGVSLSNLKELTATFCRFPQGFQPHAKIKRIFEDRLHMANGGNIDWGMAEYLAYATLLTEGIHVRLSGQDSGRGTFSHRHALLTDQKSEEKYCPLNHLSSDQASFDIFNSPLSEYAVMGFEYGYSLGFEKALVIWEAQFGDFANGAQITIDQYVTSSGQKWGSHSSLTLLLPHGYEGMGPEHSSARIERFLQLAGNESISIVVPSSASQFYHALRRQGISEVKRPLILFSPKGLLRYPPSSSPIEEIAENTTFQEVLDDPNPPKEAKKLLFCTGKVFYNLIEEREKRAISDTAILRFEQLYPLPEEKIRELLTKYRGFSQGFWVQEEHENMGAWEYIAPRLQKLLPEKSEFRYVGRVRSASPAAGSGALHKFELTKFLNEAFE
jgi:2-oxoglutarate dehydrogenase E1 component